MRVLGATVVDAYLSQRPRPKECLSAFLALVETADWQSQHDVETDFRCVVAIAGDRATFDFPDHDVRIVLRLNYSLRLARVVSVGLSTRAGRA